MNIDDFRYMWRGKQRQPLYREQAGVLAPIDIRGQGNERALLLLHGFSSSPAVYRQLLQRLPAYDAVVCPLLPGHGDSIAAFAAVKTEDWFATAEQSCAALVDTYKKVDVLGLSLGGLLACHLGARFKLHHLYLLSPALDLQFNIPLALTCAHVMQAIGFKYLRNRAGNLYSPKESELAYRLLPLATIIEILDGIRAFQFTPPSCPTDLFLGRHDNLVNTERVARRFADLANVRIHWLPKSAHVLPLDSDVDLLSLIIAGKLLDSRQA